MIPIFLGLLGLFFFQGMKAAIAVTIAVAAGGIFYMLFYDMIPKAHKEKKFSLHLWRGNRIHCRVFNNKADRAGVRLVHAVLAQ